VLQTPVSLNVCAAAADCATNWYTSMSLRAEAYEKVRDEILRGGLELGARTSEREIAERVEMSRTPVREALAVLVATGLLDQVPQVGVAVRRIDAEQALRAVRLRAGMEPVMVDELVSLDAGDLSKLRDGMSEMCSAYEGEDAVEFMLADTRMHTAVARLAGFNTSVTGLQGLRDQVHLFRRNHPLTREDMQAVLGEHDELMNALEARDEERAKHAITAHLAATRERIGAAQAGDPARERELVLSR
jgi:DNA-binding GntR family transcriptional regulator